MKTNIKRWSFPKNQLFVTTLPFHKSCNYFTVSQVNSMFPCLWMHMHIIKLLIIIYLIAFKLLFSRWNILYY